MDLELDGKRAVVTGAGKGIGLATARRLAQEGADVIAVARTSAPDEPGIKPVLLDLTAPESAAALADVVGEADILVNNLGGVVPGSATARSFLDVDDAIWQSTFELNLFSTVRITRALLPGLLRRSGVIVNVSSIGARASFRPVDYGTAKAALNNLTKALAEEFGSQGSAGGHGQPRPDPHTDLDRPAGSGRTARPSCRRHDRRDHRRPARGDGHHHRTAHRARRDGRPDRLRRLGPGRQPHRRRLRRRRRRAQGRVSAAVDLRALGRHTEADALGPATRGRLTITVITSIIGCLAVAEDRTSAPEPQRSS